MSIDITDQKALRRALGQFATAVCVMTCRVDGEALGMTMTSFNSLSLDPPLVLFSIDCRARGLPQWERATGIAIHVLSESQMELSNRFARPGDKFLGLAHRDGLHGAPVLSGVAALFECSVDHRYDAGDHRLFICRVERHAMSVDRRPLLFAGGRYATIEKQQAEAPSWPLAIHY
ncbi:flavin reductase family protein [Martelella sp. HB161492]|uniref:flavin reductase family protein n=1 Tax=Martelella sp. HB161492 TaxID=2720726 RepID=UPI001590AB96|nr:flavin reductase family protein [Martelella sp. HB161492]